MDFRTPAQRIRRSRRRVRRPCRGTPATVRCRREARRRRIRCIVLSRPTVQCSFSPRSSWTSAARSTDRSAGHGLSRPTRGEKVTLFLRWVAPGPGWAADALCMGKPSVGSGFRHTVATLFQPCLAPGVALVDAAADHPPRMRSTGPFATLFAARRADRAGVREGFSWIELESFGSEASSPAPF
jgi:hypothetical protein